MATRRERVILELQDDFTSGMARAAAATAVLDKNLNSLSGSAVQSDRSMERTRKSIQGIGSDVDKTSQRTRRGGQELDRYSGRLRLLTEAAVTLGPALVPLGAAAVPAVAALAAGLGAAAGALGVTVLAAQGLGDALGALNDYQLEPTVDNLHAMQAEFDKIGPSGKKLVLLIDSLEPKFRELQNLARAGLLPGVEAGLTSLSALLPQVRLIVFALATEMGNLAEAAGSALSGERFADFFTFLETQAGPILADFGSTLGHVAEGLASLTVAFAPLTGDFAAGMDRLSRSFAGWAAGVSQTEGFQDFIGYIRDTGPEVIALLGAIGTAFVGILRAAAPVGDAVLPALTALAKVLAVIADSPIGPPLFTAAAAMLVLNRATLLTAAGMKKLQGSAEGASVATAKFGAGVSFVAILSGIGAVNAAFNKLDERVSGNDLGRNLEALARGETVDNLKNIGQSLEVAGSRMSRFNDLAGAFLSFNFDDSTWEKAKEDIEAVDQALATMVESGRGDVAAQAFDQIIAQAAAAGVSATDAAKSFNAYQTALENAGPAAAEAADAQNRYTQANATSARVAAATRSQVRGLTAAMEEQRSTALSAFDAVTQYGEALDAARKQAAKSNAGLDASTAAGRENRTALGQLAAAWNAQGDAVRDNVKKQRDARRDFIDLATSMGAPIEQARRLAKELLDIPTQRVIDIKIAGSDEAADKLAAIRRQVESIPRQWRTDYYVNQVNSIFRPKAPSLERAAGGPIYGPGTKTSDSVPVMASTGEFMMSAAAVDHYGIDTMFKMNARHLAGGGPVGGDLTPGSFAFAENINRNSSRAAAVEAIADLRLSIRRLNGDFRDSSKAIRTETKERDRLAAKVDKNQEEFDRVKGLFDDLAGAIGSGLAADFSTPNPFKSGGGVVGDIASLKASTGRADAFTGNANKLDDYLSGAALESVLRRGDQTVQMYANLPPELLAQYQAAFDTNATAVGNAGSTGARTVYGNDVDRAKFALAGSQAELQAQTVELRTITRQNHVAEKQRDRAEKLLGEVRDVLHDIKSEHKKQRGETDSGARNRR